MFTTDELNHMIAVIEPEESVSFSKLIPDIFGYASRSPPSLM